MNARPFVLAFLCAAFGCTQTLEPRGQIILYVDTDAIVPPGPSAPPDAQRLSPLVDRVRFEVRVGGQPLAGSSRDFAIDEASIRSGKVSFGLTPAPNDPAVSVRVRLFRADRVGEGGIPSGVAIDTEVTLPPVGDEGIVEVSAFLRTDDFGRTLGPLPATPGRPSSSLVSSWRGGRHLSCGAPAGEGMTCVPGGSFFFGDPAFRGRAFGNDVVDERLVWISPFYLDTSEVTVGAFRAAWPALAAAGVAPPLTYARKTPIDDDQRAFCTWNEAPTFVGGVSLDTLPLTCIPWESALAYCRSRGAELPTEAQFEYAASGLGEEWAFPWGNDEPACEGAVWGRGGIGAFARGSTACIDPLAVGWVALPGSGARDRIIPASSPDRDRVLLDLGGNVAEWALDAWSRPSEPFWSAVTPMVDPISSIASEDAGNHPVRGGNWSVTALTTRAAFRTRRAPNEPRATIGFRCAKRAEGPVGR